MRLFVVCNLPVHLHLVVDGPYAVVFHEREKWRVTKTECSDKILGLEVVEAITLLVVCKADCSIVSDEGYRIDVELIFLV